MIRIKSIKAAISRDIDHQEIVVYSKWCVFVGQVSENQDSSDSSGGLFFVTEQYYEGLKFAGKN